ncbi:MAG: ATP synthase F1 subunit gamma [Tissierellia bacterium]|nr:ATP synthase F1 subunit gamma [Tissierellia bacterium]
MAESTRDIKRRVKGISNIKQITKAMELIASVRLRRAREKLERTRPYYRTIYDNIRQVLSSAGNISHPYLDKREGNKTLYIVVTADRGLAGGFNSNIIKLTEEEIKDKKDSSFLITVGLKGRDYFRRKGYNIVHELVGMTENPTFSHAKQIGQKVMEMYKEGEVDAVKIVYTKFITTISQETNMLKLLPSEDLREGEEVKSSVIEYEPSPEAVLDFLIPKYIESVIYGALMESSCSQQGARRTAMENATDNAEEMLEELQLSYNRARQAAITMEITEIVTGAEALK